MPKQYRMLAMLVLCAMALAATGAAAGSSGQMGSKAILSPDEEAGLLFVREEEKLARDVYQVLFEKWGLTVFENITASEQQHMDAVLYLLGKYELVDPALEPGLFQNEELQQLYDQLVAKGLTTVVDALEVGVIIEETDIDDLQTLLSQTEKVDITRVYSNLLDGSFNHLEAFYSHL